MAEPERKPTPWRVEDAPTPDPAKGDGPTPPRFRLPGGRGEAYRVAGFERPPRAAQDGKLASRS